MVKLNDGITASAKPAEQNLLLRMSHPRAGAEGWWTWQPRVTCAHSVGKYFNVVWMIQPPGGGVLHSSELGNHGRAILARDQIRRLQS